MVYTRHPHLHIWLSVLIEFVRFILGVVVVVTFKCIAALLNPAYRRGDGIKWGLVCYTATIFSLVTVLTGMHFNIRSISYIDNRNFPGAEGMIPPGPFGYQQSIGHSALSIISNVMFVMCIWLANGLLVSSLFDVVFAWPSILKPAPSTALLLLHYLRQEPPFHRIPLPHVPQLCGYVFEFSMKRR